ncbi:uncharacterized protein LOC110244720, partial [Exaiptasia diaphana]|uniref:Uncharacterized protein n=1 Tax=Exaiptasia diaphana TaxID=2652724 RepID=A0A913XMU9_EXADI
MKVSLREGANRLPLDEHKDNDLKKALQFYLYDCQCGNCTRCQRNQENPVSQTQGRQHITNHGSQASHWSDNRGMPSQGTTASHVPYVDEKDNDELMECPDSGRESLQLQESLHRSVQASVQMLYDVFDYTIGMLEELEKHEGRPGKHVPPNSGIFSHLVPLNYKKPEPEVIAGIEAGLQCLSIQMRYLPKDVINDSTR